MNWMIATLILFVLPAPQTTIVNDSEIWEVYPTTETPSVSWEGELVEQPTWEDYNWIDSSWTLGSEPGWRMPVFARGVQRSEIQSTPIHLRSYRPFHFYGNTVRRNYYRGNPVPTPRDMGNSFRTLWNR